MTQSFGAWVLDGMDRFATTSRRWAWLGVLAAVGAVAGALAFAPVPADPDHLTVLGHPWRQSCDFRRATGLPCTSCGMTRAWVWAVRGELGTALRYNIAGTLLLAGILGNGVFQAARLVGWRPPAKTGRLFAVAAVAWATIWLGSWALRLAGAYPLP